MGAKQSKGVSSSSSQKSTRSRTGSVMAASQSESENNAGALTISEYQKSLLREAWKRMSKKGTSNIGSQIFRRMFDKSPDIKRVFQHIAVIEGVFSFGLTPIQAYHHHSVLFIEILDDAINSIDDLSSLIPKCNEYGAKHAPFKSYGFQPEFWDIFGEAMIAAAREWEGWKKHRETLRAWTILVSFIVDRMRNGYETAVRRLNLNTQTSLPSRDDEESTTDEKTEKKKSTDNNDRQERSSRSSTVAKLPSLPNLSYSPADVHLNTEYDDDDMGR